MNKKIIIIFMYFLMLTYTYSEISKIYFKNMKNWEKVNAYVYNHNPKINEAFGVWPGKKMEKVENGWYYLELQGREKYYIIFNNGQGEQNPKGGQEREQRGNIWYDGIRWYDNDPKYLDLPELKVEPAGGIFSNDNIGVYINAGEDSEVDYKINTENWKKLNAGLLNIDFRKEKSILLRIKAKNSRGAVISEYSFKQGVIPIPLIRAIPSSGFSNEDFLIVELKIEGSAEKARYQIDNTPWIQFKNNCTVVLEMERLKDGQGKTIKVYAENLSGVTEDSFTFVKKKNIKKNTKIHFKNVENWDDVYVYSYGEGTASMYSKWPGDKMTAEGNNWFDNSIEEGKNTFIVFNNGKGEQFPEKGSFLKNKEEWFNGYFWSNYNLNSEFSVEINEKDSKIYNEKIVRFSINGDYIEAKYTLNGENPKTKGINFRNNQELKFKLEENGEEVFLRLYVKNSIEEIRKDYKYRLDFLLRDLHKLKVYNIPLEILEIDIYGKSKIKNLENSLEEIKSIGFNAIAINPFYNRKNRGKIKNHYRINETYGNENDLKELIEKAHKYGIYVFFNYDFFEVDKKLIEKGTEIKSKVLDIKYFENSLVIDFYKDIFSYWIDEYEIDGWQFYNAKKVGEKFLKEINLYIKKIGERRKEEGKYWGIYAYRSIDSYIESVDVDSIKDNNLRNFLIKEIAVDDGKSKEYKVPKEIVKRYDINSDSTVRFGDLIQRAGYSGFEYYKRYKTALMMLMTKSGVIDIYYGDEIAGEVENFIFSGDNGITDDEVFKYYKKSKNISYDEQNMRSYLKNLIKLRDEHPAIYNGEKLDILKTKDIHAYLKIKDSDRILYVLNSSKDIAVAELDALGVGGEELIDLQSSEIILEHNYKYNIILEGATGKIFLVK